MNKKNAVIKLIEELLYKRKYKSFINWLIDGTDFFTAPASACFHNSYERGLLDHSFHVYKLLKEKNRRYKLNLSDDSIFIAGMFHDISKIHCYQWNEKSVKYDKICKPFLKHGELSVQLLKNHLGYLKDNEAAMIRYHMGAFDEYPPYNEFNNAMIKYPEIVALCCADWEAGRILEKNYEDITRTK